MQEVVWIGLGVSVIWLGAMVYYLFLSRQHKELGDEIEKLRQLADRSQSLDRTP